jgi:phage major head subunit gpT-like protein
MIVNKINAATTGFKTLFNGAFTGAKPLVSRVATEVPSDGAAETYAWLGQFPGMREWLGDRVVQNLEGHDYTIKNKPYEGTIGVNRDAIEDDKIGIYKPLISEMGRLAAEHPDFLTFSLLKKAFTEKCYDGQYFIDTDHPVKAEDGTVQSVSNFGGGSGTPWFLLDSSRAIKPLIFQTRNAPQFVTMDKSDDESVFSKKQIRYGVDARWAAGFGLWQLIAGSKQTLDSTNYTALRAGMMSLKGDGGRPLNIVPNLLVVPPSLEGAARAVVADKLAGGADNPYAKTAEVLVVPYLS